jgi:hypothetical protein
MPPVAERLQNSFHQLLTRYKNFLKPQNHGTAAVNRPQRQDLPGGGPEPGSWVPDQEGVEKGV